MTRFSSSLLYLIFFFVTSTIASEIYTNVWAVKIRGGQREVEKVGLKYGFSYDKHLFQEYHTLKKPELEEQSEKIKSHLEVDRKLQFEPKVEWFMHQKLKKYQLFSRTDPRFREQWYIATRAGKMGPSCLIGNTCFDPMQEKHYMEQTYKVHKFWTMSTMEQQKAAKDSQTKKTFMTVTLVG